MTFEDLEKQKEDLEKLSDDEIAEDTLSMLSEDNKLASFKLARRTNMQMGKMIEAFGLLAKNMDFNLSNV